MRMKKLFKKGLSIVLTGAMVMSVVAMNGVTNAKAADTSAEKQATRLGFDYYKEITKDYSDKTNAICQWKDLTENSANTQDVVYGLDGTKKVVKVYLGKAKDGTKLKWYIAGHDHVGHIDNSNVEIKPDQTYLLLSAQQLGTSKYHDKQAETSVRYPGSTLFHTIESYCYSEANEKKGTALFSKADDSVITALPLADDENKTGTNGQEVKLYAPDVVFTDEKACFVIGYAHNSKDSSRTYIPVQEQYYQEQAKDNNGFWTRKRDEDETRVTRYSWYYINQNYKGYNQAFINREKGVVAACNIDFSKVNHMSLLPALQEGVYTNTGDKGQKFDDAMTLRVNGYDQIKSRAEYTKDAISVYKSAQDDDLYLCVQGENQNTSDGSATLDYGYSVKIDKTQTISLDTIKEAVGSNIDLDASSCKIWLEKAADEKSSVVYAVNAEQKSEDTAISQVAVTFPLPQKGDTIAQNVSTPSSDTEGVSVKINSSSNADKYITYYKDGEEVSGEKKAIGGVTYTAKANFYADSGYTFAPWIAAENVTVNGNPAADVVRNKDGSITVSYDFMYDVDLVSAVLPTVEKKVANGTEKTVEALGLPTKTTITVAKETEENAGEEAANTTEEKEAEITWDLENLAEGTYDPAVTQEQTFKVKGTVVLPEGVANPNKVPLTTVAAITATEKEKIGISSVAITNLDAVKPTFALDEEATTATEGVTLSAVTYKVKGSEEAVSGKAKFNTTYVASITVTAKEGYKFADDMAKEKVTINEKEVTSFTKNENGTITVTYETTTPKAKITKVVTPDNITVANGAPKTAEGLGLPATVTIETEDPAVTSAPVTWYTSSFKKYNPEKKTEQKFQVEGRVTLPEGISNENNIFLTVKPYVTVLKEGENPSGNTNPGTTTEDPAAGDKPDPGATTEDPTAGDKPNPGTTTEDPAAGDKPDPGATTADPAAGSTKKAKLVSITQPGDIKNVPNGTAKTASALGLPKTVAIVVKDSNVTSANVTWNLVRLASGTYNPQETKAQTFRVNGTVLLPAGVENTDKISLTVTVQVSVLAKEPDGNKNVKNDGKKDVKNDTKNDVKEEQKPAKELKEGEVITDKKTKAVYRFVKGTLQYAGTKDAKATTITIPAVYKVNGVTYKITAIADNACKNNKNITKVTIGANVKTIGNNAFSGCKKLTKVTIGKNVKTIGKNAFGKCKSLKFVTITSEKLKDKSIGKNAFKGTAKNITVFVPKKTYKTYKQFLVKKGFAKKAKMVTRK